jgi:hypothetical protein
MLMTHDTSWSHHILVSTTQRVQYVDEVCPIFASLWWFPDVTALLVGHCPKKSPQFASVIQGWLWVKIPRVHGFSWKCRNVCTRWRDHSHHTRLKEHHWHIHLDHPGLSAMRRHRIERPGEPLPASSPQNPDMWVTLQGDNWDWAPWQQYKQGDAFCMSNHSITPWKTGGCIPHSIPQFKFSMRPHISAYTLPSSDHYQPWAFPSCPTFRPTLLLSACQPYSLFYSLQKPLLCWSHPYQDL